MDILNLEFPNLDRDRHIITPVYEYLKKKHNVKAVSKNLHNRFFLLCWYRPKMLLLSNAHGQNETIEIMKVAHASGIKVITLVTEGNFHEENLHGYLWGWNYEKKLNQDAFIFWNEKSRQMSLKHHPELEGKLFVSGATGFDRYALFKFRSKTEFLSKHNLNAYKGIIGIAGFGVFDHLDRIEYLKKMQPAITDEQIQMHIADLEKLRQLYFDLAASNPDILFIIRQHPQVVDTTRSEFTKVVSLPNVIISNNYQKTKYELNNITDVISVCDIWMGYESTTVIEAWLLKKPAVLINPTSPDFVRENHSSACPKLKTLQEVQDVIQEFFATGKIAACEQLQQVKEEIINDIIGHNDGQNHRRAGDIIMHFLKGQNRPSLLRILRNTPFRYALRVTIRYYVYQSWLYKKIRPNVWASHHWYPLDKQEVKKYEELYRSAV
jgi:surface carbohydrate biosynthesis protein